MIQSGMHEIRGKNDSYLTIILDDEDEVISSIEQAFKEQNIKKAVLLSAEGRLKNTRMAVSKAGTLRQRLIDQSLKIKQVSGEFNKMKNDYFGDINVSLEKDAIHVISGVLLKGFADKEVTIRFKIIKDLGFGINEKDRNVTRNLVKEKIIEETAKKEPKPMIIA
ncbi:MAG: DUF296 domain-containing protein [Candidatus ainarchaeum sp.]|nr:DUF296 domain-containing protein [Candidatus ainarchaeum sp.]MDD3084744.1 DUF296 domain-containing protein [Candidatus ainarchaeum sp.]MDD4220993.1 DUF296 domain-containing protein [Candidatus ainarchaeum sp.]MDD4662435.1 DUF296 domain-containing protein [Candidatus ainarchaeum sp.]